MNSFGAMGQPTARTGPYFPRKSRFCPDSRLFPVRLWDSMVDTPAKIRPFSKQLIQIPAQPLPNPSLTDSKSPAISRGHGFVVPSVIFLWDASEKEKIISVAVKEKSNPNIAQRLMTGQAAETYFKNHYSEIPAFANYKVEDVTCCGCGFDFHLSHHSDFYCVEVKGLAANSGSIAMTEKEYSVADELRDRYCLFVVRNFQRKPAHSFYFNPITSTLSFTPQHRTVTSYLAYL